MTLKGYVFKKVIQSAITIFVALTLVFVLFRILPGDPVSLLIPGTFTPSTDPELVKYLAELYGIDKPLAVQYWLFLVNTISGKFGYSFLSRELVMNLVAERLVNTLLLVGSATIFSIIVGVASGIVSGWFRGKWPDKLSMGISFALYSAPVFWLGMIFVSIFGITFHLFPTSGMYSTDMLGGNPNIFVKIVDLLRHLVLPVVTLGLMYVGQYSIVMRSSLIDVLSEDYILTARAKGLTGFQILRNHALRNAALPTVTLISLSLGAMVTGAVATETVFNYPGIGRMISDAILLRDYALLQGAFLVFIICIIAANFIADMVYLLLDPRVRYD